MFYDANNNQLSASAFGVRHLFTGQQWYQELGLYDLRNRFYSPDLGRFLQPDPIGFWGGRNLYRYCRNNPVTRADPFGTCGGGLPPCLPEKGDNENVPTIEPVIVPGEDPNPADISRTGFLPGDLAGWPTPLDPERVALIIDHGDKGGMEVILRNDSPSVEHPPPSSVPPQNPPPPGPAPAAPTSPSASASPPSPSAPAAGVFSHWGTVTPIIVGPVNLGLDDDGSGPSHNDRYHSRFTSYRPGGVSLNADTVPYIVAPQDALSQGVRAGDTAFVIGNGTWAPGIVGDIGSSGRGWGEVSLRMAWDLGVPTIDVPYPTGPVIPESFGPIPATIIAIPTGY